MKRKVLCDGNGSDTGVREMKDARYTTVDMDGWVSYWTDKPKWDPLALEWDGTEYALYLGGEPGGPSHMLSPEQASTSMRRVGDE